MTRTTTARIRRDARRHLEPRVSTLREHRGEFARPNGGWVSAIRQALGMSTRDLAARMGVTDSTVVRLEASERADRAQLNSLRRAAAALDCDLVYALVPRRPLEQVVREQAQYQALKALGEVRHTMLLEDQEPHDVSVQVLLDDAVSERVDRPGLWRD
jgi:predicted DNA-binding mobile mystery protein A